MRKSAKIIQINGFRGLLTAIFVVTCLIAGFVAFPGYVAMNLWNRFVSSYVAPINLLQGILLWAMIAITYFIISKQSFAVSFGRPKELDDAEMNELMDRIRMQTKAKALNQILLKNPEKAEEKNKEIRNQTDEETADKG